MLVEFTIASGPPIVEKAVKLSLDNLPTTRQGTKYTFEFLMVAARLLDHDEFFVLRTADTLSAGAIALIRELSTKLLGGRPILILDGGVSLASLNANQIRTRLGL